MPENDLVGFQGEGRYTLTGWRTERGDWHDIEDGDRHPRASEWDILDLVTVNLQPSSSEGFYRSARVFRGLDNPPDPTYELPPPAHDGFTLDDLAFELGLVYGFYAQ